MRCCIISSATRLLLAVLVEIAVGQAARVHAVTPAAQNSAESPSRDKPPHGTPGGEGQDGQKARPPVKAEAHKAGEPPGKAPVKGPAGKGQAAKPPGGDQKGHGPPAVAAIPPAPKPPPEPPKETGEPPPKLPRFAALKTDETNMRKGPGQRYPIDWVYKRRDLPMEVEREYDVWRLVRDPEGVQGWVHQVTLSERRTFMIKDKDATLRDEAKETGSAVALLKAGVIGRLRECDRGSKWCQVQVGGYKGYLRRDQIWGLLPDEPVAPS